MENEISRLLHQCCVSMLQERWPLWKAGFFGLDVNKGCPAEMCFPDK